MRDTDGPGEGGAFFVCQGTALNADERDWLTDASCDRQEGTSEEQSFGLTLLVSTLAANRQAGELEHVAHRLWTEAQLESLRHDPL